MPGLDNRLTDGGTVFRSTYRRALLQEALLLCFWYYFPYEAERTPGPSVVGRIR
jgi:hypothetical protein